MKSLRAYINEKLVINKNYINIYNYYPTTKDELRAVIQEHYNKGIFDLNDIDVSEITDFSRFFMGDVNILNKNFDISKWNVSNGKNFSDMFFGCKKFNCDISNWDVSNGTNFDSMFYACENFNCDLSKWRIKNNAKITSMFHDCGIENKYKPKRIK